MLDDKVIVITGGSGLLGRAMVSKARSLNATVLNLEVSVSTNWKEGHVTCDITSPDSVRRTIGEIRNRFGRIDGWVNNAYPRTEDWGRKFEDILLESWRKNVDMQLNSVFFINQLVLERMKEQGSGSIVNISSIYGVVGNDFTVYENTGGMTSPAAYAAIKGGVVNLTRYLASYYGAYNVRVNCVSPGGIRDKQHPEFIRNFEHKVPMKRMGLAEEIAPAVCFLLSDDASYITGHNLMVDGGWTAI